jgi:hypothetical protein
VYDWDAGGPPYTPIPATRPASPPPAPAKKRFSTSLGDGLADITQRLRRSTIAMHTRRRVATPTVDERGSPIERTDRRVFTSGPSEPVLRLDTPGRVSIPNNLYRIISLMFLSLFFRHIGCSRNSHVDSNGQQGYEDVNFLSLSLGFLDFLSMEIVRFFLRCFLFPRRVAPLGSPLFPNPLFWWVLVSMGKFGRDSGWFLAGLGMSNGRFGHEMGVFRVKNLHEIKTVLPIFASQFSSLCGCNEVKRLRESWVTS